MCCHPKRLYFRGDWHIVLLFSSRLSLWKLFCSLEKVTFTSDDVGLSYYLFSFQLFSFLFGARFPNHLLVLAASLVAWQAAVSDWPTLSLSLSLSLRSALGPHESFHFKDFRGVPAFVGEDQCWFLRHSSASSFDSPPLRSRAREKINTAIWKSTGSGSERTAQSPSISRTQHHGTGRGSRSAKVTGPVPSSSTSRPELIPRSQLY